MGNHHLPTRSVARIATIGTAASVMAVFCYGTAAAAPGDAPATQGDLTTTAPATQGALTSDAPSTQGELTAPAAPATDHVYWVPPPPQYDKTTWKTWDAYYDNGTTAKTNNSATAPSPAGPAAPLDVSTLHAPAAVEKPTTPIAAPDKTVKVGNLYAVQPRWLSDQDRDRTNDSTAVIEAQVTDFWRSIGVPTDRAQRLSAAQIAAGGAGMIAGGVGVGAPAAVLGALGGGTIGGIAGAAAGGLVLVAPGIAPLTTGVIGTAAGAAIGAAAVGAPMAALGAATGLALGVAAGTTYGAGDLGEPQKVELPDIPVPAPFTPPPAPALPPAPKLPDVTLPTVALPVVSPLPAVPVDTARSVVAAQPGGRQVLDAVDKAAATAAPTFRAIDNAITAAFGPHAPAVHA